MPPCPERCVAVGYSFARSIGDATVIFPENVRGLVREESYKVPHSELAMYVGAAGKELLAWALTEQGRYAHIAFVDDKGCCHHTHGLPSEVLNPEMVRVTKEMQRCAKLAP